MDKGWWAAIGWVVICGAVNAFLRVAGVYDVNPFVLISQAMLAASFILIALAGPGSLGLETVRAPHTWMYGVNFLISTACFVILVTFLSATEAALLINAGVVASFIIAPFVGRRWSFKGLFGLSALCLGLFFVLVQLDHGVLKSTLITLTVFAFTKALQFYASEAHATNTQVDTFRQRLRVTGYVMAATALLFLGVLAIMALISVLTNIEGDFLPELHHFASPASFILAMIYGFTGLAGLRYCEFLATRRIGFEYFAAFVSGTIATTFLFEIIFSFIGLYEWQPVSLGLVPAALLIMVGSYMTMLMTQKVDPDANINIPTMEEVNAKYERDYGERNAKTQEGYKALDERRDADYRRKVDEIKKR